MDKSPTIKENPDIEDRKGENRTSVKDGAVEVEYTDQENRAVVRKYVASLPFEASR